MYAKCLINNKFFSKGEIIKIHILYDYKKPNLIDYQSIESVYGIEKDRRIITIKKSDVKILPKKNYPEYYL